MTLNKITWSAQRAWLANIQSDANSAEYLATMGGNDPIVGRGSVHAWVTEQVNYWTKFPTYAERADNPIVY